MSPRSSSLACFDRVKTACWPLYSYFSTPTHRLQAFLQVSEETKKRWNEEVAQKVQFHHNHPQQLCQLMHAATQVCFPADAKEAGAQFQAG